jgi:hypothetical protein
MFRSHTSARSLVSRSSSRRAVAAGLGAVVLLGVPTAAGGDPAPADGGAPIRNIVAPVRDIVVPTSDLRGAARVDESEKEVKVRLSSEVLFPKDSARLRPGVRARLTELAEVLQRRGRGRVAIVGYTDDLGSARHGVVCRGGGLPLWHECCARSWTRPTTPSRSPAVGRPTRRCPTPPRRIGNSIAVWSLRTDPPSGMSDLNVSIGPDRPERQTVG